MTDEPFNFKKLVDENQIEPGVTSDTIIFNLFPYIVLLGMLFVMPIIGFILFIELMGGIFLLLVGVDLLGKNHAKDVYGAAKNFFFILFDKMLDWDFLLLRRCEIKREMPVPQSLKDTIFSETWNRIHSIASTPNTTSTDSKDDCEVDERRNIIMGKDDNESAEDSRRKNNGKQDIQPILTMAKSLMNIKEEEFKAYMDNCYLTVLEKAGGSLIGIYHQHPLSEDFVFKKKPVETQWGTVQTDVGPGMGIYPGTTYDIPNPSEDTDEVRRTR